MQSDLKNLLQASLDQRGVESATLAAIGEWMRAAAEERARLLDEFARRVRANPATTNTVAGPRPRGRARGPIAGA